MKKLEYRNDLKSFIFENYIDLIKNNIKNCKDAEKYFSKKDYRDTKNIEDIFSDVCVIDSYLGDIFNNRCIELMKKGLSYENSLLNIITQYGHCILSKYIYDFFEYLRIYVQIGQMDIFDGETDRETLLADLCDEIVEDFLDTL